MTRERPPRLPEPTGRVGALFYALVGGLATAAILATLHHLRIVWIR